MKASIPFLTLVESDDAEYNTKETVLTLDVPPEINIKISRLESENLSDEIYDPNREIMLTQTKDPNNKNKPHIQKNCNYCHKSSHFVSNCLPKQRRNEGKQRKFYSRSTSFPIVK